MRAGGHFHYSLHFFQRKLSKGIQKFMRVRRKSVKNWSKIAIMKLEAVVFGVMRAVMINYKSTLPDFIKVRNCNTTYREITFSIITQP